MRDCLERSEGSSQRGTVHNLLSLPNPFADAGVKDWAARWCLGAAVLHVRVAL